MTAAGAGTGHTLGQGFYGKVTSMAWNGSPVAVKEVSGNSLDAASIGAYTTYAGTCFRATIDGALMSGIFGWCFHF